MAILFLVGIILVICTILWVVFTFNLLVRYRYLVREAWSGIDVQLKRRYNLIPNLVAAVKGYMQFEKKLLENIAALRSKNMGIETVKDKGEAENALSRAFKSIFAVVEAYPDLKTNQSLLDLQKNLVEVEDAIQMARRYYNGAVRNFNILVELFPSNMIAKLFNFRREEFFEIEFATERQVPEVKVS